jgi:probable F420-dependent oxidoreductase
MKLGVSLFPRELGDDPVAIRDFAQAIEGAGYNHVLAAEHVIGGHPDRQRPGERVHTYEQAYYEPFVLFGFIAGCTNNLEVVTSILILPQRQTALVAKQAAQLDLLTRGRLRLGVGLGRNWMEYEVLNEDFHNRGRRVEEQIAVLRRLWTEELVTFDGRWHQLDRMGLNPLPVQRPIPIWMGTYTQLVENAIKRVARIADGWFPQFPPNDELKAVLERMHGYAREAGRDPATLGIEGGLRASATEGAEAWQKQAEAWKALGGTHLRVSLAGDFASMQEKIDLYARVREALEDV